MLLSFFQFFNAVCNTTPTKNQSSNHFKIVVILFGTMSCTYLFVVVLAVRGNGSFLFLSTSIVCLSFAYFLFLNELILAMALIPRISSNIDNNKRRTQFSEIFSTQVQKFEFKTQSCIKQDFSPLDLFSTFCF